MFKPWKGAKFGEENNAVGGIRLLVLGESHYCDDDPSKVRTSEPNVTTEVVERYALEKPQRFFTGITQVLSGKEKRRLTLTELHNLWASICFYNYVPVYLPGSRVRPSPELFRQGVEPFAEVLAELDPQAILVCGFDLWRWVLDGIAFGDNASETPFCEIGSAIAARMMHPSATGFSSIEWRPTVISLLDDARSRAAAATMKLADR